MSAAYVSQRDGGKPKQLDTRATPQVSVTEGDAAQPAWLARVLTRVLADIAEIKRRFAPDRITFRDIPVAGTAAGSATRVRLAHNLGQLVEWWPVRAIGASGTNPVNVYEISQDGNVLVLDVRFTGTLWIRCEGAG
jgi:hypothetical protein